MTKTKNRKRGKPAIKTGRAAAIKRAKGMLAYHANGHDPRYWASRALANLKTRARAHGYTCDVTHAEVVELLKESGHVCPITGLELQHATSRGGPKSDSVSLMILDREAPITARNIAVVSTAAATAISRLTLAECVTLGQWAQQQLEEQRIARLLARYRELDAEIDSVVDALLATITDADNEKDD